MEKAQTAPTAPRPIAENQRQIELAAAAERLRVTALQARWAQLEFQSARVAFDELQRAEAA
jgi:hypothetical protein